jgi:plastocyanin
LPRRFETFWRVRGTKSRAKLKDDFMIRFNRVALCCFSTVLLSALAASVPAVGASAGHEYVVPMANMAYGPIPGGLKVGDSIVWVNHDSVPHTVTARDHSFDLRIGPGQRGRLTLGKAGTFPIYCILHSPMRGTITVGA